MILLRTTERRGVPDVVAIFGLGLIGRSIVRAFERSTEDRTRLPFSWIDAPRQRAHSARVEALVETTLARNPEARLTWIWSAGRAGFSANELETARAEERSHRRVDASLLQSLVNVIVGSGDACEVSTSKSAWILP